MPNGATQTDLPGPDELYKDGHSCLRYFAEKLLCFNPDITTRWMGTGDGRE